MAINEGIFTLQEFNNRGVIKLAPDALLYIGGGLNPVMVVSSMSIGSTNGRSGVTLNDGLSSININNTIENPGSSTATIEITTPIYGERSQYWVKYPGPDPSTFIKYSVFVPMMEVKVFFKGRFMVNDSPQYYQAFWGFITHVEENYNGGVYKISLQCCDILHWWSYHRINVHPTVDSAIASGVPQPLTYWSTVFEAGNVFSTMRALTEISGEISFVSPAWLAQLTNLEEIYPSKLFKTFTQDQIMPYWRQRFATIGSLLKMYGLQGQLVDKNGIRIEQPISTNSEKTKTNSPSEATESKIKNVYGVDQGLLEKFPAFGDLTDLGKFEAAEYQTRLEVATELKNRCQYEFFQDTNGNFIFKPPFYNLNVKGVQPYTIRPNDIITFSLGTDAEGITTVMTVNFPFALMFNNPSLPQKKGFHMDVGLVQKYGIKYEEITAYYMAGANAKVAKTFAAALMGTKNARSISGTITIPGRPEMKMGYPVYVEHRDAFYYVKSISHSFDYGGSFTTTLGIEAERKKVYELDIDLKMVGPPSDRSLKPMINGVYRLAEKIVETAPISPNDPPYITKGNEKIKALLNSNLHTASSAQGRYIVDYGTEKEKIITDTTYPFTDEEGYAVIGAFTYGRGLNPYFLDKPSDGISKETYQVTKMEKPAYKAESDAMKKVFSNNEEGTVPIYVKTLGGTMPSSLGTSIDVHTVAQAETVSDSQKTASTAQVLTNATAGPGNVPTGILVDQGSIKLKLAEWVPTMYNKSGGSH